MGNSLLSGLLNALTLIPTADNTQPWKISSIRKGENYEIELFHSGDLAKHTLNNLGVASIFSMGFVMEIFDLVAKKNGYELKIKYNVDEWSKLDSMEVVLVAKLFFYKKASVFLSEEDSHLFNQLEKRHTNRNLYNHHEWSQEMFADLNKKAMGENSRIIYFPVNNKSITSYVAEAESVMWKEFSILKEILNWVRFTDKEVQETKNGLNGNGLGFKGLEWSVVKFVIRNKFVLNIVRPLIAKVISPSKTKKQLKSSTALAAVTVSEVNFYNLIQSGRLMMRQWLLLTQMGYVIHPYTLGSLNLFNYANDTLASVLKNKYLNLFKKGADVFKKVLNLSSKEEVTFFFRLGLAEELTSASKSRKQSASYFLIESLEENLHEQPSIHAGSNDLNEVSVLS